MIQKNVSLASGYLCSPCWRRWVLSWFMRVSRAMAWGQCLGFIRLSVGRGCQRFSRAEQRLLAWFSAHPSQHTIGHSRNPCSPSCQAPVMRTDPHNKWVMFTVNTLLIRNAQKENYK